MHRQNKILFSTHLFLDHSFGAFKWELVSAFICMDPIQHQLSTTVNPVVEHEQDELDGRAMSALLRKIDLRLMPLLTSLYFFTYLCRINIGKQRILTIIMHVIYYHLFFSKGQISDFELLDKFKLSKPDHKWTVSIFFISYVSSKSQH